MRRMAGGKWADTVRWTDVRLPVAEPGLVSPRAVATAATPRPA